MNNQNFDSILKFQYLRRSITGNAEKLIQNLGFVESNYIAAWEALCDKYDNEKVLVHTLMTNLFKAGRPCACKRGQEMTGKMLEDMYNKTTQTLEALKILQIDPSSCMITHLLISKSDDETLAEWEKSTSQKEVPTLKQILDFLLKRQSVLKAMERAKKHTPIN